MSIQLAEYLPCLGTTDLGHNRQVLESAYHEATRIMSPRGLQQYLLGMKAMCSLGKSHDLILAYVQELPQVVKEVGEDIIPDLVTDIMKLSSHTSGTVITLLITNLPLAAHRLGDAEVLRSYLNLIHQLASKAPRGLRPMLEVLDELLSKLTLGGLRRWALWGSAAHARDFNGQVAYFGLKSEASKAVLQKERRGTLFIDQQRRLNFYLRALWGRDFFMRPTAGDYETRQGLRPSIQDYQIHVPDAFDDYRGIAGLEIYRAAVAHCAAHLVYTTQELSPQQLNPVQMKFIELFEDARVEYLACQQFPGLQKLFLQFFTAPLHINDTPQDVHPATDLMLRQAQALLDVEFHDEIAFINELANSFRNALKTRPYNNRISWEHGVTLYHHLSAHTALPNLRILENWPIPYRDDNRLVWDFNAKIYAHYQDNGFVETKQIRRYVSAIEMANEVDCELAGDDAQEIWALATPFWLDQEGCTINELEGKEPISAPYFYPEWDYQAQLFRPNWTTVVEHRPNKGNAAIMDELLITQRPLATRIRHLIDALQPQGLIRKRGYEEGEELDLNAAVRAMIDIRRKLMPDPRINIRITRHIRDLAILVLMDLSASTNESIVKDDPNGTTVLQLTREATGLLTWAVDNIGDRLAVHGFASNGRHDVRYFRFKDFQQRYDDTAKARLAAMNGQLSTRMGAALRHAGWHLSQQAARTRLILLITDGEPADIDERDPQYLRQDAKKAVEELAAKGIHSYCLTLDSLADHYVARIFGENRYSIVDQVQKLPERLPAVFAMLTG
jgi:hypothetical protein